MTMQATNHVGLLAGGLLAVMLTLLPASAMASCICSMPDAPKLPSAETADGSQMQYSSREIESYQGKVRAYKQCLESCLVEADQTSGELIDRWNAIVDEYNAARAD